jgi:hypothetical protein
MSNDTRVGKILKQISIPKKKKNTTINNDSSFSILTDDEIALVLAYRAKQLRIQNNMKQKDFSTQANLSSSTTYSNFEQTGKSSLLNFIKIVRAFGRINELESLLKLSVGDKIERMQKSSEIKQRVR